MERLGLLLYNVAMEKFGTTYLALLTMTYY